MNDLPMLSVAGRSVAIANARQEVLSVCDDRCSSNQNDGVAEYLDTIFPDREASS